jgi:hypothetical protein
MNHRKIVKKQWREFGPNDEVVSHSKIQAGASLRRFNAKSLKNAKSNIYKVLELLDQSRDVWLGKAEIHKITSLNLNSLSPVLSTLFSLEFVDRQAVGKRRLLYRLKADINVNDKQTLYDKAIKAKHKEQGRNV